MRKLILIAITLSLGIYWIGADADAQSGAFKRRRARRPSFSDVDRSIYFKDIFRDGLVGSRPADFGKPKSEVAGNATSGPGGTTEAASDGFSWSSIVDSMAIENEIKALKKEVDASITTPNKFASGGFSDARFNFTMLATVFAVISEYDGDVRFKKSAPEARQVFARMAANSTAGSNAVFQQAKQRKGDLQELISGGSVTLTTPLKPLEDWSLVCDRGPLMQRLELALNERMKPLSGSDKSFNENSDVIWHEANMVALISEVLIKEGMQDGDEEEYMTEASKLKTGALSVLDAIKKKDYDQASNAIGQMSQACTICHETWN